MAAKTVEFSESAEKEDDNDNANRIRPSRKVLSRSRLLLSQSSIAIKKDQVNFGIPSRMGIMVHTEETHGEDSWRKHVLDFLHRKWFQMTMNGLLILDILMVFAELSLMIGFPTCRTIERDCIACCGIEDGGVEAQQNQTERWLSAAAATTDGGGDDHYGEICPADYDETGVSGCDEHKYHAVHITEEVLFYFGVTILVIFLIENLVEMAALGISIFFKQIFLATEFIVVLVSLILELTFHLKRDELASLVGILVMFRIWRFVRIGHGIAEVTSELTNEYYDPLIEFAKECEKKLKANNIELPEKCKDVEEIIDSHGQH